MRILLLTLGALFIGIIGYAQEFKSYEEELDLEIFIERLFPIQDIEINYNDLYESLYQYYLSPVNLNEVSYDELASLYLLTDYQIDNFFSYIEQYGDLVSIYELRAVPGFDMVTIRNLLPFVRVAEPGKDQRPLMRRIISTRNNSLILRYERILEESNGYKTTPVFDENDNVIGQQGPDYLGNRDRYYMRFRVQEKNDFSVGITAEKDPGEQLVWDRRTRRYGMDYYSGHIMLENKLGLKRFVIGDYQLQFGQGLLFNGGFGIGKGAEAVKTVKRTNLGVRPYTSVLETDFLRGAAATYALHGLELTAFYSKLGVDGNIQRDTLQNEFDQFITSLQNTGLHRTKSEIAAKRVIGSETFGGNLSYRDRLRRFLIGATFLQTQFTVPVLPQDFIRNRFRFRGDHNYNVGGYTEYQWKNIHLFCEGAFSQSGGLGGVAGFTSAFSNEVQFAFLMRNYEKNFHSFYGDPFAESSIPANEKGIYWGITINPISNFIVNAFYDHYNFPWLRTGADSPSGGGEYRVRLTFEPSRQIMLFLETRGEKRDININDEDVPIRSLVTGNKKNYTFNLSYTVNPIIQLKSRIQMSSFTEEGSITRGFAILQDVNFIWRKLKLSNRIALIDTDDNENRQYFYERNVLWANTLFSLSGQSVLRWYSLFEYKLSRHFQFQIRFAQTHAKLEESLGSGRDEIKGNTQTQVTSQLKIVF
jgi:hypothetical protein